MVSVADAFTVLNALLGFSAVIAALEGELELAYLLIIAAVIADGVDGIVARRFGSKWMIGDFLDIMADTASFAFAPSVIMYITFREGLGDPDMGLGVADGRLLILVVGGLVIATGVMRLARFCYEPESDEKDKYFTGMPIPSLALMMAIMLLMGLPGLVVVILTVIAAVLMVSDLRYPKPRGAPSMTVGVLGLLVIVTTLLGDSLELISDFLIYLTFTAVMMYQYLGPFTERVRERYIDEEEGGEGEGPAKEP
jgi:CDP-diacylglycerol--serine O-phosphatidyltransferase